MEQNIIAVSQVNEYIKFLLDRDELLGNICVRGELSNYKVYPSATARTSSTAICSRPTARAISTLRSNS